MISQEGLINEILASSSTKSKSSNSSEENQDDEWLSYYMFGKIKEKLKSDQFEILNCYTKV